MNNFFKYGFFSLIAIIIVIFSFKGTTSSDKLYINELELKVKSLNDINSQLEADNSKIITELAFKMDSIAVLKSEVVEIKHKKILLSRYYEKKIKDINRFSVSELDSAFSARYR